MSVAAGLPATDLYGRALTGHEPRLRVRAEDGGSGPVPLDLWLGPLTAADATVLDRVAAPVLDVGCGPGRHVLALARRGVLAVGVDVSPDAVHLARRRGATVIERCVFDRIPGAGTWGSVLLLDGNIGIGGDPEALLVRLSSLLRPGGVVLAELAAPGTPSSSGRFRLEGASGTSEWFRWARLAGDGFDDLARRAGLVPGEHWSAEGRWFTRATRT